MNQRPGRQRQGPTVPGAQPTRLLPFFDDLNKHVKCSGAFFGQARTIGGSVDHVAKHDRHVRGVGQREANVCPAGFTKMVFGRSGARRPEGLREQSKPINGDRPEECVLVHEVTVRCSVGNTRAPRNFAQRQVIRTALCDQLECPFDQRGTQFSVVIRLTGSRSVFAGRSFGAGPGRLSGAGRSAGPNRFTAPRAPACSGCRSGGQAGSVWPRPIG